MGSLGEIIRTKYYHNYTRENQWHSYSKSLNILDSRTNHSFRLKKAKWQKETKKPILVGLGDVAILAKLRTYSSVKVTDSGFELYSRWVPLIGLLKYFSI